MKLILILIGVLFAGTVQAGPDRISFLLGSHHVNSSRAFEEVNPGVFVTWENPHVHWAVGAFRNSYERGAVSAIAAIPVLRWREGEASLFAGAALYPKDGRNFGNSAGDVIPIGGVQIRHRKFFAQVLPLESNLADAVVSFGLTFPLKK